MRVLVSSDFKKDIFSEFPPLHTMEGSTYLEHVPPICMSAMTFSKQFLAVSVIIYMYRSGKGYQRDNCSGEFCNLCVDRTKD